MATYEPPPCSKAFEGTTTHFPRVNLDVDEGLTLDILDPIDS